MTDDTPPRSVRNIISIFENQTEPTAPIRRSKSMVNLRETRKPVVKKTNFHKDLELAQIDQQIQHLQTNLDLKYRTYSRDNHIYYQNQVIFILTDIANTSSSNVEYKLELTERLKRLTKSLNLLLPPGGSSVKQVKTTRNRVQHMVRKKKEPVVEVEAAVAAPQEEPEAEVPVSVRSLKEIFEKNSSEPEAKREFRATNISRNFATFNGTGDFKYVTFSERNNLLKKQISFRDETLKHEAQLEEENKGELSPDSLSDGENGSSDTDHTLEGEE